MYVKHINFIYFVILATINPLNAELNPICHLLALLGGATIVVVSRLRVNGLSGASPESQQYVLPAVSFTPLFRFM